MTDTQSTHAVKASPVEILYRLRDMNAELLYVGITRDWPTRMTQHQREKPWWSDVAAVELVKVNGTRQQIEAIERAVIKTEQPTYNKTHNAEVRRLTVPTPKPEEREVLFWRDTDNGYGERYHQGDRVMSIGLLGTLVGYEGGVDCNYIIHFDGEARPTTIDGTCSIRHAQPGDVSSPW